MVDARDLPLPISLSPGQASDKAAVAALLGPTRAVLDLIETHGSRGHTPTQRDRKGQRSVDPSIYRRRNLVERFFNELRHFRKVATRYEKTARNELAATLVACSRIWIRIYEFAS